MGITEASDTNQATSTQNNTIEVSSSCTTYVIATATGTGTSNINTSSSMAMPKTGHKEIWTTPMCQRSTTDSPVGIPIEGGNAVVQALHTEDQETPNKHNSGHIPFSKEYRSTKIWTDNYTVMNTDGSHMETKPVKVLNFTSQMTRDRVLSTMLSPYLQTRSLKKGQLNGTLQITTGNSNCQLAA